MKKLLLLLCLSVPAWAQIINNSGGATPAGSSGQLQINNGSNGLGASTVTADGSGNLTAPGSLFVGAGTPNEGTTGTDLNATAEFVNTAGAGQLKKCATSKRYCFLVVKETSCGGGTGCTTGNAYVQGAFTETDTFSNTAVAFNWFKGSTTAAGQVEDTGTANSSACPTGVTCLGWALTAGSGAQTVVRTAPVIGPNTGGAQTNAVVFTGTPNTTVTMSGSEVSLIEYKTDNTGIVNGTGVASSVFSAAGQCVVLEILFSQPAVATTIKTYYGGTSVTNYTSGAVAQTAWIRTFFCTTTNTSTENISTVPMLVGATTSTAPSLTPVAVDGTVGQLIKVTTNGASGNVIIKAAYLTKLF